MLTADRMAPRTYLRDARIDAGYASRDTAAASVHFSPEAIGRHERGEVDLAPCDVMRYADAYRRDDVLFHYCAQCPAGVALGRAVEVRPLPLATIRVSSRLRDAADIAERMEAIADDGVLTRDEYADFDVAVEFLKSLELTIADYRLLAARENKGAKRLGGEDRPKASATAVPGARSVTGAEGKGRPAGTGRPFEEYESHSHCTASGFDCQGRI